MAFEVNAPVAAKVAKVGIVRPKAAVSRRPLGWNEMSVRYTEPWPTAAPGQELSVETAR